MVDNENIDDELVFGIFKKRLEDFDLFMALIMDWAGRQKDFKECPVPCGV